MKKGLTLLILFTAVFSACKLDTKKDVDNESTWKFSELSTEKKVYIDNDSLKPSMKLVFAMTYPSAYENDTILNYVQHVFSLAFAGKEYANLKPEDAVVKIENESLQQAADYAQAIGDDSDDFADYYQTITTSVSDTSRMEYYITAKTEANQYTGGAHGMYNRAYFNADTRTGDLIDESRLFKSDAKPALTKLMKELLPKQKNSAGDLITLLDPESIAPNNNFYFTPTGIVYVFNPYEVAPYSDGIIQLEISYDRLKELINPDYSFLLEK